MKKSIFLVLICGLTNIILADTQAHAVCRTFTPRATYPSVCFMYRTEINEFINEAEKIFGEPVTQHMHTITRFPDDKGDCKYLIVFVKGNDDTELEKAFGKYHAKYFKNEPSKS